MLGIIYDLNLSYKIIYNSDAGTYDEGNAF